MSSTPSPSAPFRPAILLAVLGLCAEVVSPVAAADALAGLPQNLPAAARSSSPFIQPEPPSVPGATPPKAVAVTDEELLPARVAIPHTEYQPSLVDAVLANDDALVNALLEAGVATNGAAPNGDTPLCAALRTGRLDLAILFLVNGADPNKPGLDGHPPIALASLRRHPQLMRVLLAADADPNKPFLFPVSKEVLAIVPDAYLRTEMKTARNVTPLMACAARGDVEAVSFLLQWGADKNKHTLPHYRYAINFAADRRYLYVMRLLLGRNPDNEPRVLITIDLSRQRATLAIEGVTKLETSVSTGRDGYNTPAGRYVITNKYKNWVSTIYDVPMPWFMRLNCGSFGLHSGYVSGRPESHGCIRLPHEMAKKFFSIANVGDEVNIEY